MLVLIAAKLRPHCPSRHAVASPFPAMSSIQLSGTIASEPRRRAGPPSRRARPAPRRSPARRPAAGLHRGRPPPACPADSGSSRPDRRSRRSRAHNGIREPRHRVRRVEAECPRSARRWTWSRTRWSSDQITGFQAIGTSRYLAPSFSTWPMHGKVKWKPTTVAFSADAMS
jgi:hypothetical protein